MAKLEDRVRKEFNEWSQSATDTCYLTILKVNAAESIVECDFGERCPFTITFPDEYPKSGSFFVHSEDEWLAADWLEHMTNVVSASDKLKFAHVLDAAVSKFVELGYNEGGGGGEEAMDDGFGGDEYGGDFDVDIDDGSGGFGMPPVLPGTEAPKDPPPDPVEQLFKKKKFKQIGSPSATLRLISDLKNLYRENTKKHGFEAIPKVDPSSGLENLYEWEVRLFDFEGSLAKDLKEYTKKTNKNYITVSMKFSKDYPSKPPFIRIVEPRFQFRTAHVTLGGAVCMEVLTLTGWKPILDVMSVILMLRAEIGAPDANARLALDNDQYSGFAYNEQQAWEAFYRAAGNHGWDTKGLGPELFSFLNQ